MRLQTTLICLLIAFTAVIASAQENLAGGIFKDAITATNPRTVKIFGASVGNVDGYGTGLLVSDDGMIITSDGVYLRGYNIRVVLNDGTEHIAKILRRDPNYKLALLQIEAKTPDHFKLTDKPIGKKGDFVLGISNCFKVAERKEMLSTTLGIISLRTTISQKTRRQEVIYDGDIILLDCITSNPGAGGGAVVNESGGLVGMIGKVIQSRETNTRMNYAVPQEILSLFLQNKLVKKNTATVAKSNKPADLGVRLFQLDGRRSPAYVDRVTRGGPFQKAGIRPDDLVINMGGESIANVGEFKEVLKTLAPGEEITVVAKRRNKLMKFKVTPAEKK